MIPDPGIKLIFQGTKPNGSSTFSPLNVLILLATDFTFDQARLLFNGEELWRTLGIVFGNKIINGFKLALYPLVLCPNYLDAATVKAGSTRFKFEIRFGMEGKMKVKKDALLKNMQKVLDKVELVH